MLAMLLLAACVAPQPRQDIAPEVNRGPLVVTTTGAAEFLTRELLNGVIETRLLGPVVPRARNTTPTPDEEVLIGRAAFFVAYGGDTDRYAVEMIKAVDPAKEIVFVRAGDSGRGFSWLDPATLREDARELHALLLPRFEELSNRSRIDSNLVALESRINSLEQMIAAQKVDFPSQQVFTDDTRLHPFLASIGVGVLGTVTIGENGQVSDEQRQSITALAADQPGRILVVTHPEKKERLGELAREADLTIVYFNPFLDGVTGVGRMDEVIPRQMRVLRLAMTTALAASTSQQ